MINIQLSKKFGFKKSYYALGWILNPFFLFYLSISSQAQTLPPLPSLKEPTVSSTSTPSGENPNSETNKAEEISVSPSSRLSDEAPVREFTFQAPSDEPSQVFPQTPPSSSPNPTVSPSIDQASFYQVEVLAIDESILEKVKVIEPFAFWEQEKQVVYAGRFDQQDQAQDRVQELTQKGLSAKIVPVSR